MSTTRAVRRQRGTINKRACENCRRLKIRCDGDSAKSIDCSNCDAGTCVYDKSPRKNRQVEKLSNQVSNLEANLERIQNDLQQQTNRSNHIITVLKLEKEIQGLLYNCQNYFNDCHENQIVFEQLNQIIAKSQCWSILLPLVRELLIRLSQNTEPISIINTLRMISENTMKFCQPDSSFNPMTNPPPELADLIPSATTISYNSNVSSSSELIPEPISPAYSIPTTISNVPSPTVMINISPISAGSEAVTQYFDNLDINDFFYFNGME
ncbi:10923_t:CDS:1 [Acaulospora colombiana]|uniref:10923_t:CDS:1 n=1 Tax=Acaulospora colombiana TaxID=27376 RepID=A0ACA9LTH5_9GLOM|nr:10923_t:CDS:1 [Acaulospora colombiana]